ncbi:1,2-phenylacetyl-CoA epoxidase subunit PaaC [Polaromonas sp. SM01]|uniref:1,2-phenylacetyl-CoA epoxidase subunit PaaC n=1 Tax=Polaromonas sp. SM01 TaxID=3085630 RepID=UPI0029816298|nr:1,2-phenylacetyl-CoA epoxidase subunit PaaC [Polaromonas sp. SM01]MDW5445073.1 1,2-phenylacetyl-CoA epoxidase subunit PaaC [Polaromonas sp. SM01]
MATSLDYLLHLADNALVLGQRNAEWCGNGPVLEEDIALANMSLDLIGQARLLYQHAASVQGGGASEDALAYFRDAKDFRNYTLLELPHASNTAERDYAVTIVRNFLYSAWMLLLWDALQDSKDTQLAAIAGKSLKEVRYHFRHSRDWLIRLGDGTPESQSRTQWALTHLIPYTQEYWAQTAIETVAIPEGIAADTRVLKTHWDALLDEALKEAGLQRPTSLVNLPHGKNGEHSEHLAPLLADMQGLARAHPEAQW